MARLRVTIALLTTLGLGGCAAPPPRPPLPPGLPTEAPDRLEAIQERMTRLDRDGGWSQAVCRQTASQLAAIGAQLSAADPEGARAARYNQGVVLLRCRLHAEAAATFASLLDASPGMHQARVQLAVLRYAERGAPYLTEAIREIERAVADSHFGSTEALVQLAILQLQRQDSSSDADGSDDFERARKNLRRALAVDDGYMPAYNQLAIYYLEEAKRKAGRQRREHLHLAGYEPPRAETAALELAALVCSQAQRKQPGYAPIHNTAGLIQVELGQLAAAAKSFAEARQLDPKLSEAHMNYAAVNLQFRGFERAEQAYRQVLKLLPKSYEAHLGLALALRGQIGLSNEGMRLLLETEKELHVAKALEPSRPEAYFNEAILVQEFRAREGGPDTALVLRKARDLFATFIDKARDEPELKTAISRASERMRDIDEMLVFLASSP